MIVKEYENARSYLNEYENVLLEREAVSQLILYNAYQNLYVSSSEKCLFGSVIDDNDTTILLYTNVEPYPMAVFLVHEDKDAMLVAATALAQHFADKRYPIQGIIGKNDLCQGFLVHYKSETNCQYLERMGMDIMEIRQVNDIKPVDGTHRLAKDDEIKLITDWMLQYQMDEQTSELDYEAALKKATAWIDNNQIFVFENTELKLVTMTAITRKLKNGVGISHIFTPTEYRGMGYAAANLYFLSKSLLEEGYEFCSLFVDKKNPVSTRAYEKIGYQIIEECYEYTIILSEKAS